MADRVGQQLGNYRLLRLLGQGGQASVYLGEQDSWPLRGLTTRLPCTQRELTGHDRVLSMILL